MYIDAGSIQYTGSARGARERALSPLFFFLRLASFKNSRSMQDANARYTKVVPRGALKKHVRETN